MICDDYQLKISALLDGEVADAESAEIFSHMGTCADCRLFWHSVLALNAQLESVNRHVVSQTDAPPLPKRVAPIRRTWTRPIEIRAYVLSLFIGALIGLSFLAGRSQFFGGSDTIYVTKLPPVTITSDTQVTHIRTEGELQ